MRLFVYYAYICINGSRRLFGFNPCSVCGFNLRRVRLCWCILALLVHFLLWQAAKPSGDKCTPYKYPITLKKNKDMDKKNEFMRRAIELSEESVRTGGGPFGAVIVRGDEIIAEASNSVTIDNDPTAHA